LRPKIDLETFIMSRALELLEMAKKEFAHQGRIQPVVIIVAEGRSLAYPMTQQDEEERDAFFEMIAGRAKELGAESVSVVTEAWIREEDQEPDPSRPADAIYVIEVSPSGTAGVAAARVLRTPQGIAFEELEPDPEIQQRANSFSPWRQTQ
jgi:hypothetical protein